MFIQSSLLFSFFYSFFPLFLFIPLSLFDSFFSAFSYFFPSFAISSHFLLCIFSSTFPLCSGALSLSSAPSRSEAGTAVI